MARQFALIPRSLPRGAALQVEQKLAFILRTTWPRYHLKFSYVDNKEIWQVDGGRELDEWLALWLICDPASRRGGGALRGVGRVPAQVPISQGSSVALDAMASAAPV